MGVLLRLAVWIVQAQAESRGWLEQNGALIVAVLALLGTVATGYWGWRQKKQPTGEAQLDDERQYRQELRTENRDVKAEILEVRKLNKALNLQNDELLKENASLLSIKSELEGQNRKLDEQITLLLDEARKRDAKITELNASIADLIIKVQSLERRRTDRGTEARKDDNSN